MDICLRRQAQNFGSGPASFTELVVLQLSIQTECKNGGMKVFCRENATIVVLNAIFYPTPLAQEVTFQVSLYVMAIDHIFSIEMMVLQRFHRLSSTSIRDFQQKKSTNGIIMEYSIAWTVQLSSVTILNQKNGGLMG